MKEVLNKLINLSDKERKLSHEVEICREEQRRLCGKELIGMCFRIKRSKATLINCEEYEEYLCFVGVSPERCSHKPCSLSAIRVLFTKLRDDELGPSIDETSEEVSSWLVQLEEAEQISGVEFKDACDRVNTYFSEKLRLK